MALQYSKETDKNGLIFTEDGIMKFVKNDGKFNYYQIVARREDIEDYYNTIIAPSQKQEEKTKC